MNTFYIKAAALVILLAGFGIQQWRVHHRMAEAKRFESLFTEQKAEADKCIAGAKDMEAANAQAEKVIASYKSEAAKAIKDCAKRVALVEAKWAGVAQAKFNAAPEPGKVFDDETSARFVDLFNRCLGLPADNQPGGIQGVEGPDAVREGGKAEVRARREERALLRAEKSRRGK